MSPKSTPKSTPYSIKFNKVFKKEHEVFALKKGFKSFAEYIKTAMIEYKARREFIDNIENR